MSSSAALAAAKKRRNVGLGEQKPQQNNNQQQQQQQQQRQQFREPTSTPQLITQHDAKIFRLEKMRIQDKENLDKILYELSNKVESVSKNSNSNIDNNVITNKIDNHEKDITSLNLIIKTVNKTLSDIKSNNAKLHATILEQSKEIKKLIDHNKLNKTTDE